MAQTTESQEPSRLPAGEERRAESHWFEDEIDLRQLFDVVWSGRWWIAAATAAAIALAVVYLLAAQPVYQADALLRIEDRKSTLAGMEALEQLTGGGPESAAQIEILRSRAVLGTTIDQLNLTVQAEPRRLPVFHALFAHNEDGQPGAAWMGLSSYDWGGSRIRMGRMQVPEDFQGEPFTLVATGDGGYRLLGPEDNEVLQGRAGEIESASFEGGEVTLFVRELVARPGTAFELVANSRLATIEELRERLSISEQGQDTGVISLKLEGHDRTAIEQTLATIADVYLRQNTEWRSAEARESLNFIESQLPKLRQQVEQAEGKLSDYQERQETVDLTVETEKLLGQLVELDQKISGLETRRAEASRSYGPQHPVIEAIEAQLESLNEEKSELEGRLGTLPDKQRQMLSLRRELEVSTEVYTQMLNTAQELRVAEAGTIGNVRIIDDAATGERPIAPRKALTLALSVILGGFLGVALVLGRRFFQRGVETPEELERRTGLAVFSVVPHCRELARAERRFERGRLERAPLLVVDQPEDPATEALRSLRTALHFGLRDPNRRVVTITSPGPAAGKSTICVNLALLLAEIGQSVVVLDGDMRRGHLTRYLQAGPARTGLADVLSAQANWRDVAHPLGNSGRATLIGRGTTPPNPSELLLSERFAALVDELRESHDWVLIDAPPVMAVTDAAIIAHEASATFVVARSARDELAEVSDSVRRLEHGGVRVTGLILNDYGARQVGRTYQTHYYRYDYRSTGKGDAGAE